MSTSDTILLGGVFKTSNSTQTEGTGAGKNVMIVTFEVYGVSQAGKTGSGSFGAGAGKAQLTDLGSATVSLTDSGIAATGSSRSRRARAHRIPASIQETASPAYALLNINSGATINEPNGNLTLFERTV